MKSFVLSFMCLLLPAAGCGAANESGDCMRDERGGDIDSVVLGTLAYIENPDGIVPWRNGDSVELVWGLQGSLMLVAGTVVRGSDLDQSYIEEELTVSMEGVGVISQDFGMGFSSMDPDGSWYAETIFLPFEGSAPDDGETFEVYLKVGCAEIRRQLVAQWP